MSSISEVIESENCAHFIAKQGLFLKIFWIYSPCISKVIECERRAHLIA